MGFYGSGYFYNGIFLSMGPWADWGYSHGWGGPRFGGDGGGSYHGGVGVRMAYRGAGAHPAGGASPGRQLRGGILPACAGAREERRLGCAAKVS